MIKIPKNLFPGSREEHAQHSIEILEKEYEMSETLKDCILNHGTNEKPKTEEGKIMQVADKVCMLNPELVSLLLKYSLKKNKEEKEKDLEFIRKMCNKAVNLLGGLK